MSRSARDEPPIEHPMAWDPSTPVQCQYPGCSECSVLVFDQRLCVLHGTELSRYLDATGLCFAAWEAKCIASGNWLSSKRPQRMQAVAR